jgi:hypothetical protein
LSTGDKDDAQGSLADLVRKEVVRGTCMGRMVSCFTCAKQFFMPPQSQQTARALTYLHARKPPAFHGVLLTVHPYVA